VETVRLRINLIRSGTTFIDPAYAHATRAWQKKDSLPSAIEVNMTFNSWNWF
jgi:hypothetical protein